MGVFILLSEKLVDKAFDLLKLQRILHHYLRDLPPQLLRTLPWRIKLFHIDAEAAVPQLFLAPTRVDVRLFAAPENNNSPGTASER